jgi:hypothetical protein
MNRNHKITVPEPCHENWDKMTPKDNGRFCLSCTKTVVDFTTMLPEEVQHYFIQNQDKSICGRFKKSQLDTIIIQIPSQVLYSQTHYRKMFLLALFIAMGTTLFSCADKDGNKKKIDKVEVVENPSETPYVTVGVALPPKHDPKYTLKHVPPPPPPKVDQVKFVKPVVSIKDVKSSKTKTITCKKTISKKETDSVAYDGTYYTTGVVYVVDNFQDPADYPGGQQKFYTVFKRNFIIPEKSSELRGELELAFDINQIGKPDNIKVLKDLGEGIAEESIRVLGSLAKWKPAIINGKAISTSFTLKIIFDNNTDLNEAKSKEFKSQIVSIKLNPELE